MHQESHRIKPVPKERTTKQYIRDEETNYVIATLESVGSWGLGEKKRFIYPSASGLNRVINRIFRYSDSVRGEFRLSGFEWSESLSAQSDDFLATPNSDGVIVGNGNEDEGSIMLELSKTLERILTKLEKGKEPWW